MNYTSLCHARCIADAVLVAALTGGIYNAETLGPQGVSRGGLPGTAFTAAGLRKPMVVVKGRASVPDGRIEGRGSSPYISIVQMMEFWLYDDAGASATVLESAASRLFTLFQFKPIAGAFDMKLAFRFEFDRSPDFADSRLIRVDYQIIGRS